MFRLAIAAGLVLALAAGATAAPSCHASKGMHVTLFGGVDDPDVLVWDSRDRLASYSSGTSDTRKFLLPHAILNRPGTNAVVVTCRSAAVHSKFRFDPEDAVGVFITSGHYKGRYGWVSSADIHGAGIPESRASW